MSQVEMAHQDVESVLDPLLNAPCFGCKNSDSVNHRRPKFPRLPTSAAMLYCGVCRLASAFALVPCRIPPATFRHHLPLATAVLRRWPPRCSNPAEALSLNNVPGVLGSMAEFAACNAGG